MSALGLRFQAARLRRFIDRLLAPIPEGTVHGGIARALLASTYRWQTDELRFLRMMVCVPAADRRDYGRLVDLTQQARDGAR